MKRKVLIIVENESVPPDPRILNEARSLLKNGYDVTVLCPRRKRSKAFEVIEGIRIYRHPMPKEGKAPAGYLLEYSCALFWELIYAGWIYVRHGFHIIQGCNPPDDIFLIALPFRLLGVKYIFDHHDTNPELYIAKYGKETSLYRVLVWLEKLTYRFSDKVIVTNESYKEIAINRGHKVPDDVFVVRNGPNLQIFKPVPPNPTLKEGKRFLIGYVGNMGSQDGLDILVDVAQHIKNLNKRDVGFMCIGEGSELPRLRNLVRNRGLEDMVVFTGRLPDREMLEILSTVDVCVNPDRPCVMNDISTMIKIMEYMALGKPIVQFESKEGRFSAREASLYADKTNPVVDFASKILWLLERPHVRTMMGELGRNRIEKELAWKYSIGNLLAAYQSTSVSRQRQSGGLGPEEDPSVVRSTRITPTE